MPSANTFGQPEVNDPQGPQAPGRIPTSNGVDGVTGGTPNAPHAPPVALPGGQVAPGAGPQAQGVGTGFVNLQSLLMANAPQAQQQAQGLVNTAYDKGNGAGQDLGKAKDASQYANNLNSFGGLQSILGDKYGQNAYTGGQAGFDALITGAAGQPAFSAAQQAYGGLYKQLVNQGGPPAPVKPPVPQIQKRGPAINNDPDRPTPLGKSPRDPRAKDRSRGSGTRLGGYGLY